MNCTSALKQVERTLASWPKLSLRADFLSLCLLCCLTRLLFTTIFCIWAARPTWLLFLALLLHENVHNRLILLLMVISFYNMMSLYYCSPENCRVHTSWSPLFSICSGEYFSVGLSQFFLASEALQEEGFEDNAHIWATVLASIVNEVTHTSQSLTSYLTKSIIVLFYKKGFPNKQENYKQFSFVNFLAKRTSSVYYNRSNPLLAHIVSKAQKGFVLGRTISENNNCLTTSCTDVTYISQKQCY